MVAGLANKNKIGAIIQARMHSTRLPGKIILPLPFNNDRTLLEWPIYELKKSNFISDIVLATSSSGNTILKKISLKNNIHYVEGDEENVLNRFIDVLNKHEFDHFLRFTGDNPILDFRYIDELIQHHLKNENDYTYSVNMPIGMNVEICRVKSLFNVIKKKDLITDDMEHVTFYFKRTTCFKVELYNFVIPVFDKKIRLTVDYPVDYSALNLVTSLAIDKNIFGLNLIKFINENYNWIWDINAQVNQKKQFASFSEELPLTIKILTENELKHSLKKLLETISEKGSI